MTHHLNNCKTYCMNPVNRWNTVCDIKPSLLIYRKKDKVDQNLVWYTLDTCTTYFRFRTNCKHDGLCPTVWNRPNSEKMSDFTLEYRLFLVQCLGFKVEGKTGWSTMGQVYPVNRTYESVRSPKQESLANVDGSKNRFIGQIIQDRIFSSIPGPSNCESSGPSILSIKINKILL